MGFSRQECWSGLSFPPPEDLPDPRMEPTSPTSAGGLFTSGITWEAKKADTKREMSMVPPAGHFCPVPGCAKEHLHVPSIQSLKQSWSYLYDWAFQCVCFLDQSLALT